MVWKASVQRHGEHGHEVIGLYMSQYSYADLFFTFVYCFSGRACNEPSNRHNRVTRLTAFLCVWWMSSFLGRENCLLLAEVCNEVVEIFVVRVGQVSDNDDESVARVCVGHVGSR
jgi:hypothetical protein